MNYEAMTSADLELKLMEFGEQRAAIKAEALKVQAVLDARAVQAELERSLSGMSDGAKALLAQQLGVQGIPSALAIGVPGAN